MKSQRELKLEKLLTQFIQPVKNIPFELVIQSLFGVTVQKFDPNLHKGVLTQITKAMSRVCKNLKDNPIKRSRPNEAGNDIEKFVLSALRKEKLKADIPRTKTGKKKSAGYPDIKIEIGVVPIYLEVKTHSENQLKTSLRSFFLSPAIAPKVVESAFHLLVSFEIFRTGNQFTAKRFKIVDLYGLDCDMKSEFNSDNKRLYQTNRLLSQGDNLKYYLISR